MSMTMNTTRTVSEWMEQLAAAISNADWEELERLRRVTRNWLQGSQEETAQLALLNAAEEAICAIENVG